VIIRIQFRIKVKTEKADPDPYLSEKAGEKAGEKSELAPHNSERAGLDPLQGNAGPQNWNRQAIFKFKKRFFILAMRHEFKYY
jgi:hypothetical protein